MIGRLIHGFPLPGDGPHRHGGSPPVEPSHRHIIWKIAYLERDGDGVTVVWGGAGPSHIRLLDQPVASGQVRELLAAYLVLRALAVLTPAPKKPAEPDAN